MIQSNRYEIIVERDQSKAAAATLELLDRVDDLDTLLADSEAIVERVEEAERKTAADVISSAEQVELAQAQAQSAIAAAAIAQATSGAGFPTRAAFVSAVSSGYLDGLSDGQVVPVDGRYYRKSAGAGLVSDADDWVPSGPCVYPDQFPGTLADQWEAAAVAAVALGLSMRLEGEHILPRAAVLPTNILLECGPGFVARNGFSGDGGALISFGDGAVDQLPDISVDISEGDKIITFTAPHGLKVGQWFIVANPTDYSYSGFRNYYRAGEFFRVQYVQSATSVITEKAAYAAYDKDDVDCYSMPRATVKFSGTFRVEANFTAAQGSVVDFRGITDSDLTGLEVIAEGPVQVIAAVRRSAGLTGYGIRLRQTKAADEAPFTDYALLIGNSQQIQFNCVDLHSRRHACALGNGGLSLPTPVCRDVHVEGIMSNDIRATDSTRGITAADHHGNVEHCSYSGIIHGGLAPGGDKNKYAGIVYSNGCGFLVNFSETCGTDFDFRGVKFIAKAPMYPGATEFDCPVKMDSGDINENTVRAGLIDFSNTRWDMALGGNAAYIAHFDPRSRAASAEKLSLSFNGAVIERTNPDLLGVFQCRASSGANTFEMVDARGLEVLDNPALPDGPMASTTPRILRDVQSGQFDVTLNTSVTQMDLTIPFNKPMSPFPKAINVTMWLPTGYSIPITAEVRAVVNAAQFQVRLRAIGGNFAAGDAKIMWST